MYCRNCGQQIDEHSQYCPYCGTSTEIKNAACENDAPNMGFAVLGFFIPLVGLILYLVYEGKQPKKARSAGKGALTGFITATAVAIICAILLITGLISYTGKIAPSIFSKETRTDYLEKNVVKVSFGEFRVTDDDVFGCETSLDVRVKNLTDKQYTFCITIEAVDKDGARLETDIIYADRLNAGQSVLLKAFEYVDDDKIGELKNASFKVLSIEYYRDWI